MKPISLALYTLGLLTHSVSTSAYEIDTHEKLSIEAYSASNLQKNPDVQGNLGLGASDKFPGSDGISKSIIQLIGDGAKFEDTLSADRPRNHFYDPLSGQPLTLLGVAVGSTSPDWALEDKGQITGVLGFGKQEFSYRDAREYFFKALTLPGKTDREKNFGLTFQTIGMVIHHVQDMAQPQHVRNDQHLELKASQQLWLCAIAGPTICKTYFGIKSPSLYESYTNRPEVRSKLPMDFSPIGYDISNSKFTGTFNQPRKFWEFPTGVGLAQFTNANFVSSGTNFDTNIFNFPLFTPALRSDKDIQQMCAKANPPCPNPNLKGMMTFYGNWVDDRYTGQKLLNPLASTHSIFDAELKKAKSKNLFTLNRFNFEVAHGFLTTRAVAYSAGLINYFFRGNIDLVEDPNSFGSFILKNLGAEDMSGTFALYYDAVDGARYPVPGAAWNLSVSRGSEAGSLTFTPPTNPEPKTPDQYMLVFKGDMGEEKATGGAVGAVLSKLVTLKTLTIIRSQYYVDPDPNRGADLAGYLSLYFDDIPANILKLLYENVTSITITINGRSYPFSPQPLLANILRGSFDDPAPPYFNGAFYTDPDGRKALFDLNGLTVRSGSFFDLQNLNGSSINDISFFVAGKLLFSFRLLPGLLPTYDFQPARLSRLRNLKVAPDAFRVIVVPE